jgi:hypothetical protein
MFEFMKNYLYLIFVDKRKISTETKQKSGIMCFYECVRNVIEKAKMS